MRTALDVHRELLARDVPHEIVRLPVRVTGADDLPEALGLAAGCLAVRVYAVTRLPTSRHAAPDLRTTYVAVLVPAGAVPDPAALLEALDAESVRPATESEVNAVTGFAAGLVSPVALPADVEVLADAALGRSDVAYAAAGEGGVALAVRTRDLLVAVGARAATLTPAPLPAKGSLYADIVDLDAVLREDAAARGSSGSAVPPAPRGSRERPGA